MNNLMSISVTAEMKWTYFLRHKLPELPQEEINHMNGPKSTEEFKFKEKAYPQRKL